ncbi:hypothetical protein CEXT_438451 [Caerostris extrusa]|uniref:Uncharacterized protein n=1 Tax=Caerostris extrusa TaxID=172846 RepID=A0AAV4PP30_CAEEX|nr:hypothetical protein CEXT_438451 [Caerostris extrusa]
MQQNNKPKKKAVSSLLHKRRGVLIVISAIRMKELRTLRQIALMIRETSLHPLSDFSGAQELDGSADEWTDEGTRTLRQIALMIRETSLHPLSDFSGAPRIRRSADEWTNKGPYTEGTTKVKLCITTFCEKGKVRDLYTTFGVIKGFRRVANAATEHHLTTNTPLYAESCEQNSEEEPIRGKPFDLHLSVRSRWTPTLRLKGILPGIVSSENVSLNS